MLRALQRRVEEMNRRKAVPDVDEPYSEEHDARDRDNSE